jgi:integrase
MSRSKGTGCLYLRGRLWYAKYSRNGKAFFESTKQTDRRKAEKFLHERLAEIATGAFSGPRIERIRVAELAEDFLRDYRINNKKSLTAAELRWRKHLEPVFGQLMVNQVTSDCLDEYIDRRQEAKAKNATINREMAALKRMFHLGQQATPPKVLRVPHFPRLTERNVRTGFVEDEAYTKLARACAAAGLWMRGLFECGYTYDWRSGELLGLRVEQVNIADRTIRLHPGETKNDDGRVATMTPGVRALLEALITGKEPQDSVFTHRDQSPVRDFRRAWENATKKAEVPDLLFHDLRRTAVRNMVRAGISEKVAMMISGHRTRAVFDRYAIFNQRDLAEATLKLEQHREEKAAAAVVRLQKGYKGAGKSSTDAGRPALSN